jgi:hypothetical protein
MRVILYIDAFRVSLAMQKVEGSNPFSRFDVNSLHLVG